MLEEISSEIERLKRENLFRTIKNIDTIKGKYIVCGEKRYLDFCSNNYLGLRDDERIKAAAKEAIDLYGIGSGASRLISGNFRVFDKLEEKIAELKKKERVLLFNSGYDANFGTISGLLNKNDVIFSDRLNHASIVDGALFSGAKFIRYKHNDILDLKEKLSINRKFFKNAMVVTDSVFSMDGDKAKLNEIAELKREFDFLFMVDEAHGTGVLGVTGAGLAEEQGVSDFVDIHMGTLGKAIGTQGAFIAADGKIIDYLINRARSFIYTTALSPVIVAASLKAFEIIENEVFRRREILYNADILREKLKELGYNTMDSCTQIIPINVIDDIKAIQLSSFFLENGVMAVAVRPPTVPKNSSRIRVSINYNLTKLDIEHFVLVLSRYKEAKEY